jgi:hypothetical protein
MRLQVFIFSSYVGDAWTVLRGVQIVMTDDQCTRIAAMKVFQELTQCCFLLWCPRVGGLTADVQPALVAHTYRVRVMVQTVCPDQKLGPARLHLAVTTDYIVVADAELEAPLPVPAVYLGNGALLVRAHRRTVNYY